ncbi:hypothetical protein GCM10027160_18230 [Streptomyces calidiresistens]|uniref:Poxvirus protein I5 n=1 Tax=Streptomyces calidiresistens TaxID=1485586 RepID=A0A7W3T026_9ACTN|nr:hypothetical protein [Streptomyces calidiresistens]MBB0228406.1 hypothetical protein [Streptomyces calidiresistens]
MRGRKGAGLALFGETLLTGVVVLVLTLPLITLLPALAAGTAHLRRHLAGESERIGDLLRDFVAAVRDLWAAGLAFLAGALVLVWNATLAEAGVVPGAGLLLPVSLALLGGWGVLLLRVAAAWSTTASAGAPDGGNPAGGTPAREHLRTAAGALRDDPVGSLLLLVALVMCGVFVWMLLPLALLVGGLLPLAVIGVEHRARARAAEAAEDIGGDTETTGRPADR